MSRQYLRDQLPQNEQDAEKAERALAKELQKLSVQEREEILHDIHGVRDDEVVDDQVTVAYQLRELQHELSVLIKNKKAVAYKRAWHLDRTYVEGESFRKLFLLAEDFDPKKAAQRLALHFQVKQELFVRLPAESDEILVRDVTWDDLDEGDRRVAESGYFQVGPQRDVAGRLIFFGTAALYESTWNPQNVARACWYVMMSAVRTDSDMHTSKGVVAVLLYLQGRAYPSQSAARLIIRARSSLPFITGAMHICYDSLALHLVAVGFRLALHAVSTRQSFRIRFHYGSPEQLSFELQTFGVAMDGSLLSWLVNGRNNSHGSSNSSSTLVVSCAWHSEWLLSIRRTEKKNTPETEPFPDETICIIPRRFDVLFGRNNLAWEHPGTIRCRFLVRMHQESYEKASRREKTNVADQVIDSIHASKGRFLRWQGDDDAAAQQSNGGGSWVVVDDKVARDKVSHMFRNLREVERKRNRRTQTLENEHSDDTQEALSLQHVTKGRPIAFDLAEEGPRKIQKNDM